MIDRLIDRHRHYTNPKVGNYRIEIATIEVERKVKKTKKKRQQKGLALLSPACVCKTDKERKMAIGTVQRVFLSLGISQRWGYIT